MLGAWVRLTDAGLGCPDWPGCYGRLVVPDAATAPAELGSEYTRPLEAGKAWREMIHRYLASTLGLVCVALAVIAWRNRRDPAQPSRAPARARRARDVPRAARHVDGDVAAEADRRRRAFARRLRDAGAARFARPLALVAHTRRRRAACARSASPRPRRSCSRSRSAAGRARTMPRSRARISRRARRNGGPRSPISRKGSCCGAASASTTKAACSIIPRAWPCTSRTAWARVVAALLIALLGWRLAREPATRADGGAVLAVLLLQLSLGVSIVWFGVPLAVAVLHNGVAALLLLAVINANQRIRQR